MALTSTALAISTSGRWCVRGVAARRGLRNTPRPDRRMLLTGDIEFPDYLRMMLRPENLATTSFGTPPP